MARRESDPEVMLGCVVFVLLLAGGLLLVLAMLLGAPWWALL